MVIVVIVPFLNEERYLPSLLGSLAGQTRPPDRLILVDDGSTDRSFELARRFAADHPYAMAWRRPPRPPERDRLVTAAELRAFQWALERVDVEWDVAAKVDADLRLTPELLAEMEARFAADPRLGLAGSYLAAVTPDGRTVRQRCPVHHVEGPNKFYRRQCYDEISPLPAILGWDEIDELRAALRGWTVSSFAMPGGDPLHLRRMGSHDGALRAYRRWGRGAYGYGEHPLFAVLMAARQLADPPPVLGSVNYLLGWAMAGLRRAPRAEPELRAYVQRRQLERISERLLAAVRPVRAAGKEASP